MSPRLLVLTHPGYSLGMQLPEAFDLLAPTLKAEQADPTPLTIEKLAGSGYDAVVCWAERTEELELLVRIRKSDPRIPVLMISPEADESFRTLAIEKGATSVLHATRNVPMLVDLVRQALELRLAAQETRATAERGRMLSREVRELAERTSALTQESRRRLESMTRRVLLPLLVCDDPDEAFQLVRAFGEAQIFAPLPILRSGEEATAYLDGRHPYDNRGRFPLPTLLLLDLHGSGMPGLGLLSWIRQQERLKNLPVIMLSGSVNPEDIKRAYGVQANSYLIKPANFGELVEMVKAINLYWSSLNISPDA